jgi:hypothetical protein
VDTRKQARRLLALLALAWLNVIVQPCLAGTAAPPAAMEECEHGTPAYGAMPCAEMQADDCGPPDELGHEPPRAAARPQVLLGLASPVAAPPAHHCPGDPGRGPPLTIRYCTLLN